MGNENFKLEYWISYLLFILVVLYKTQRNNVNHFILFLFFKDTKYFVNNVTVDAENVPPPSGLCEEKCSQNSFSVHRILRSDVTNM